MTLDVVVVVVAAVVALMPRLSTGDTMVNSGVCARVIPETHRQGHSLEMRGIGAKKVEGTSLVAGRQSFSW